MCALTHELAAIAAKSKDGYSGATASHGSSRPGPRQEGIDMGDVNRIGLCLRLWSEGDTCVVCCTQN